MINENIREKDKLIDINNGSKRNKRLINAKFALIIEI